MGVEGGHLKWPHHINYDLKLSKWSSYTNRWRGENLVIQLVIYICNVKTGMEVFVFVFVFVFPQSLG